MISVIIPVYNVKPYLEKCLDSVVSQTYKELEIILVDDGSTDGSGKICDDYALNDPRIHVIHQVNKGLSVARNVGIEKAIGEWISFVDSDDWLELEMYETLYNIHLKYGGDIISCKPRMHCYSPQKLKDSERIVQMTGEEAIKELLTQKTVRFEVWNKLWHRKLIGNERFIVGQVSEDVHFDLLIFMKCKHFVHIEKSLYNYRVNRPGATNSTFKIKRLCVFDEFDSFISKYESKNKKLALVVATMGCSFAYNIYDEALRTNQVKETYTDLHKKFRLYYKKSKYGKLKPIKTKLIWVAFLNFPKMTVIIRNHILYK